MEEYWSCAEAGEATATKRQKVGRVTRAPVLESVTESEYSLKSGSTMVEHSAKSTTKRVGMSKAKDLDNLSEKDIEAALEGKTVGALTIWQMLKTAPKCLTGWQNFLMFIGFLATIGNGAATPAFGFTLSQLMANLFKTNISAKVTLYWALAVLGVAAFDGLTTFFKIYLLESSAEKWVYRSRKEGIKRILKQDCEWFLRNDGQPSIVAARLINSGEEMRPILGRFAGNLLNDAQHLIKFHAEVGVMVSHLDARPVFGQIPKIGFQQFGRKQHKRVVPIHAEVATVRTADTAEERHDTQATHLASHQRRRQKLRQSFFHTGNFFQGTAAGNDRLPVETSAKNVVDQRLVAIFDRQIKKAETILGKGFGVRPADDRQRFPHAIDLGQGVSQRAGLRVARDENNIELVGKQADRVPLPVVGGVPDLMSELPAPNGDGLRNYAGVILLEKSAVGEIRPAFGRRFLDQLDDPDFHTEPSLSLWM